MITRLGKSRHQLQLTHVVFLGSDPKQEGADRDMQLVLVEWSAMASFGRLFKM
jgi:hypothetical protein